MKHNVLELIHATEQQLIPVYADVVSRQQAAWWLLEKLTQLTDAHLLAKKEITLTQEQEKILQQWIDNHVKLAMPLQYILGSVPFGDLEILVEPPVLIPRPETEEWTINLINQLLPFHNKSLAILDLCCGSGCIALALAHALPQSQLCGTDILPKAVELARANATHNHIKNVSFCQSDVYEQLPPHFKCDLIVSNPPYIAPDEWASLDASVTNWEDKHALIANHEGLAIIERIINGAHKFLQPNKELSTLKLPQLVIEIGYQQGNSVQQLMLKAGFIDVTIVKDLEGKDRVVTGRIL